jgi:hypothetical protein
LPFAGTLIAHQASFLASAHLSADDKVADNAESEHRHLHFFIFSHNLPPFCGFFSALSQNGNDKNDTLRWGIYQMKMLQIKWRG